MDAATMEQVSFSFRPGLMGELKRNAEERNSTLNDLVESVLRNYLRRATDEDAAAKGDELTMTPELQAMVDEAERDCAEGRCVECRTREDIERLMDSL